MPINNIKSETDVEEEILRREREIKMSSQGRWIGLDVNLIWVILAIPPYRGVGVGFVRGSKGWYRGWGKMDVRGRII